MKHMLGRFERWYAQRFVAPQFAALGPNALMMKPWNIDIAGKHIAAGANLHVITAPDRRVSLCTWELGDTSGRIAFGDHCLVCPGVRIDSASGIVIGNNTMLAASAYVTDADWHDIYDRTRAVGTTRPVTLEDNTWVGDRATVCKGVTVGRNSVIGAGAVVASDVPPNVIVAGNPARIVKELDPARELVTREQLFEDPAELERQMDRVDRYVLHHNTWWGWLRNRIAPQRGE